ncbi:unnamed protein product [Lepidochelys olivacea]
MYKAQCTALGPRWCGNNNPVSRCSACGMSAPGRVRGRVLLVGRGLPERGAHFRCCFPPRGWSSGSGDSQVRCSGQPLSCTVHLPRAPLASALRLAPAALTALGARGQQSRANRSLRARLIVPVAEGGLAGWLESGEGWRVPGPERR